MNVADKQIAMVYLAILSVIPGMARAQNNGSTPVSRYVRVTGPTFFLAGQSANYTCMRYNISGGSYTWEVGSFTGSSIYSDITVTAPTTPATNAIKCTYTTPSYTKFHIKNVAAVELSMVTPAAVNTPSVYSGDGQNKYAYSADSPGVLTMNLKAHVKPANITAAILSHCNFTVGAIGNSALAWDGANPGGRPSGNGDYLEATLTFTGLPPNNSDFGAKKAAINLDGKKCAESDYEVFYQPMAKNHPGGNEADPNWFYYWQQVVTVTPKKYDKLVYGGAAVNNSAFYITGDDTVVICDVPDIHAFSDLLAHENEHAIIFKDTWESWQNYGITSWQFDKDGDYYRDSWEETNEDAQRFGFDPTEPGDAYREGSQSAGTRYEEELCKKAEDDFDETSFDSEDWSVGGQKW